MGCQAAAAGEPASLAAGRAPGPEQLAAVVERVVLLPTKTVVVTRELGEHDAGPCPPKK